MDLISREDALAVVRYSKNAVDGIENLPSVDAVEVKHGEWVDKPTGRYCHIGSYCSVCGEKSGIGGIESNRHKPYCPNCGAKMDGKRE